MASVPLVPILRRLNPYTPILCLMLKGSFSSTSFHLTLARIYFLLLPHHFHSHSANINDSTILWLKKPIAALPISHLSCNSAIFVKDCLYGHGYNMRLCTGPSKSLTSTSICSGALLFPTHACSWSNRLVGFPLGPLKQSPNTGTLKWR